jgi:ribosome biogenesis protein NSA1
LVWGVGVHNTSLATTVNATRLSFAKSQDLHPSFHSFHFFFVRLGRGRAFVPGSTQEEGRSHLWGIVVDLPIYFTMRVICGDECGILKECLPELEEKKATSRVNAAQTAGRRKGCMDMCWMSQDDDKSFASLSMDGTCTVWERSVTESKAFGKYRKRSEIVNLFDSEAVHPSTKPLGLFRINKTDRVCAGNAAGSLSIVDTGKDKVVHSFQTVQSTDQTEQDSALLTTMTVSSEEERVAVGGQERDVTVWDLTTGKELWKAKNAKPDAQTLLQQQVWPTAISFVEPNMLAVGSAHCEVRLYDIRLQRRPVALTPKGMWEHRITALCPLPNKTLVTGDSAGFLQTMDWRNMQQTTGRFVGPGGSIRQVVSHPTASRLAVVGLDRMLRIYDSSTRKQLHCLYLRQRLNCVLFCHDEVEQQDDSATLEDEGEWDQDDQNDRVVDYVDSDEERPTRNARKEPDESPEGSSDSDDEDDKHVDVESEESGEGEESGEESSGSDEASVEIKEVVNPRKKMKR